MSFIELIKPTPLKILLTLITAYILSNIISLLFMILTPTIGISISPLMFLPISYLFVCSLVYFISRQFPKKDAPAAPESKEENRWLSLIKPNYLTIGLLILIFVLSLDSIGPWTHPDTYFLRYLFYPLTVLAYMSPFFGGYLLALVYAYILASLLVFVAKILYKKNKFLIILFLVIILLLFGIDAPIINSTINRPNVGCDIDSDCAFKTTSTDWCGGGICANKGWNKYQPLVNSVFALSCMQSYPYCTCEANKCVEHNRISDLDLCEKKEGEERDICLFGIFSNSSPRSPLKEDICPMISKRDLKIQCYKDLCAELEDETLRRRCYYAASETVADIYFCEMLEESYYKSECLTKYAIATQNASLCMRTQGLSCIFQMAVAQKNVSICKQIFDSYTRDECYSEVSSAMITNNSLLAVKYCDMMTTHSGNLYHCYNDLAVYFALENLDKSLSFCDSLSGQFGYGVCIQSVAVKIAKTDVERALQLADSINDDERRYLIYELIVAQIKDIDYDKAKEICEMLPESEDAFSGRAHCLRQID